MGCTAISCVVLYIVGVFVINGFAIAFIIETLYKFIDKWKHRHEYGNGLSNVKGENDIGHFTTDKENTSVIWSFYSIIIINDNDIFEFLMQ